jgi:kynurenine formamidase
MTRITRGVLLFGIGALIAAASVGQRPSAAPGVSDSNRAAIKGWKKGSGWGWIWGRDDEVGALNSTTPETVRSALSHARTGKVYDLGVAYSRNSYKWPGHSPGEIITFRSPEGVKRQKDVPVVLPEVNPAGAGWHSSALFISDNVATQIDGLGHITIGDDNHWYNGFKEADWGGNFGIRRCDVAKIPPIVARGVLLDIAGAKNLDVLPESYAITPTDVQRAMARQRVEPRPGDVILIRTGTLRYWGQDGADQETIKKHDSAGITLETAKFLVENFGPVMIASDTRGLEVNPAPKGADCFIPVHKYLLIEQGVYIGEFHNLEDLVRDKAYEFCYIATTAKIQGAVAGFCMRPIAIR